MRKNSYWALWPPQMSRCETDAEQPCRMRKKAVQQGRSERRGEAYACRYGEPLSEARTPLADFFRILLTQSPRGGVYGPGRHGE
ncbi:MAG: hypothetical protein OJF47_001252 [Nitrospira sp.]|jgi:hypothetical protein|nr:MAG: hypothetical protein OJF47_001252 [Nitrospira sp.]